MRFSQKIAVCIFLFFHLTCGNPSASRNSLSFYLMKNVFSPDETATYTIGGTVSGLTGIGLVLQNNAKDDLPIIQNGNFVFKTKLSQGEDYLVSVLSQPLGQTCTLTGESGKVTSFVNTVAVTCNFTSGATNSPPSITFVGNPFTYTQNIPITTNTPAVLGTITTCTVNPALPTGLTIDNATCAISGTPTTTQSATTYTITASNAFGSTTTSISMAVANIPPSALAYTGSPFVYIENNGTIATLTPTFSGSISTCSVSPTLPTGLSLNNTTCTISGSPTAVQAATSYTITASNAYGSTNTVISITVNIAPPSALAFTGSPFTFSQGLAITTITPTVSGVVTGCSTSPALPTGLVIDNTTCAISGAPTISQTATTYTLTASNASGNTSTTIQITVNNSAPSGLFYSASSYIYTKGLAIAVNTPTVSGSITNCSATPSLPTGLTLNTTTCAISGTPTTTQLAAFYTITASNAYGNTSVILSIMVNETAPSSLTYAGGPYTYTQGLAITTNTPTISGTITGCSISPTLPAGLVIDNSTCAISGTPTASRSGTWYTVLASNANGQTTATINITVNTSAPSELVYTGSPFIYTQNAAIATLTPTVTGTITICSASPALPAGLTINNTTCAISGTPTALQTSTPHTITASNPYGSATAVIYIAVSSVPPTLSYAGSPFTFTQGIAITTITPTITGTVTSCSTSPTLPIGLSINTTTCAISGTPTTTQSATTYTITASNPYGSNTASVNLTVNIPAPSGLSYTGSPFTFTQNLAIATITPTVTGIVTGCSATPSLPTGLSINATTCAISGTPTSTQATTAYSITASNPSGNTTTSINITINIAPPSALVYTGNPYTYTQNAAITTNTPTVTGTVTGCSAAPGLPTGLSINPTTCAISGTPTVTQAATAHTITASNAYGSTTAVINITVNIAPPSALTYSGSSYTYTQNSAITANTPTVSGTVTSCSTIPALPTGLSINTTTCSITGTPTVTQTATTYTITAANAFGSTTATISITVNISAPSSLTYTGSPYTYTQNVAITTNTPTVAGAVTSCSSAPALPAGLTINNTTCAISGTPTATQAATSYTITASNAFGSTTAVINITINLAPPSALTYTGSPYTYSQNSAITTNTPTVTGTVTSCSSAPALPAGLTINNTTCAISGTPTATQAATSYTITASNAFGSTTATISITINTAAPTSLTYTGSPYTYIQNSAITTNTPTFTGTVTSCSSAPALPAGLSINNTTCAISGTPTTTQAATSYTITASNAFGNTTATINITINPPAPTALTYSGSPYVYGQTLAISTTTPSVTGIVTNCTATPGLPTGLSISTTTCAISGTPTGTQATTSYTITASNISGSTTATISITVQDLCIYYGGTGTPASCLMGGQVFGTPLTFSGNVTTPYGPPQGSWTTGITNGIGNAARFYYPIGIATDRTNLYVVDWFNHQIRKIEIATGTVSLFAGAATPTVGSADGIGNAARFNKPGGITTDGTSLYVSDSFNCTIRKIDIATANVTTIGGSALSCITTNGTGAAARFNSPYGITLDSKNLYIADWGGHTIRQMVLATGVVTVLAGSGTSGSTDATGTSARFSNPFGIVHLQGNLYIGDEGNHLIRKIVIATGVVTTLAGTGTQGLINGAGTSARFKMPEGMATDGTNLYVADSGNLVIRKIVIATGVVSTFAGSGALLDTDGTLGAAAFDKPQAVISDGTVLYVADTYNNKIRKIE